jgi:hypothetical protein
MASADEATAYDSTMHRHHSVLNGGREVAVTVRD